MNNFLNIYPWLFFYLLIFSQITQGHKIYRTKKTEGLSIITFLIYLSASIFFGWTCFLGGESTYSLLLGNGLSTLILSYIIFNIWKNNNFRFKYLFSSIIFLNGLLILALGTINYLYFKNDKPPIFKLENIQSWILVAFPTLGGISSTMIFIPQLIKIIKTKKTKNLHYFLMIFYMFYLINIVVFWILYGVNENEWSLSAPSIIFSSIGVFVQIIVISLKYKYERKILIL